MTNLYNLLYELCKTSLYIAEYFIRLKGKYMQRTYCPHCGTKWFIEELNYTLSENINGYKISEKSVIIEHSARKLSSSYTQKCVSCGYEANQEKLH